MHVYPLFRKESCKRAYTESQGLVLFGNKVKISPVDRDGKPHVHVNVHLLSCLCTKICMHIHTYKMNYWFVSHLHVYACLCPEFPTGGRDIQVIPPGPNSGGMHPMGHMSKPYSTDDIDPQVTMNTWPQRLVHVHVRWHVALSARQVLSNCACTCICIHMYTYNVLVPRLDWLARITEKCAM